MQGDKNSRKQSPQGDLHAYLGWKITQQGTHEIGALYSKHVQVNLNFLDNTVRQDIPMFTQSVEPRCGAVESGSLLRVQPKVKRHSALLCCQGPKLCILKMRHKRSLDFQFHKYGPAVQRQCLLPSKQVHTTNVDPLAAKELR
jgi:hypothetical protein